MRVYDNYLSLKVIKRKIFELLFDIKLLIFHIINNNLFLPSKLKQFKKIHFGAGSDIKEGFLNVDLSRSADISLDVRNKLNIKSDTIEFIYSSHFIEHLEHGELVAHLNECYRILKKNAVLRLGVPDFEKVFHDYLHHNNSRLNEIRAFLSTKLSIAENLICRMDRVNRAVHEFGEHKICLDLEKVRNLLISVGFKENRIIQTPFQEGIDLKSRESFTFYVEAKK